MASSRAQSWSLAPAQRLQKNWPSWPREHTHIHQSLGFGHEARLADMRCLQELDQGAISAAALAQGLSILAVGGIQAARLQALMNAA